MKLQKFPFFILCYSALIFSVLKTIRFPNDWAEAHWMLDYRFGFIKRGLAGEIFGFLFQKTEFTILGVAVFLLISLYAFLLFITSQFFKIDKSKSFLTLLFCLFFFLSQYVVFSAHTIGYLDGLIFLITIFGLFLIQKNQRIAASFLLVIALFIHEISLFLMMPICLATIAFKEYEKSNFTSLKLKRIAIEVLKFVSLPIIIIFGLILFQGKNESENFKVIFDYLQGISFISKESADSVASAYTKSFQFYLKEEIRHFLQRIFVSKCTIFYGIPLLMMMHLLYKIFNRKFIPVLALFFIAAIIPLILHAMAWDTYRIWSFPYIILFLALWVMSNSQSFISQPLEMKEYEFYFYIFGLGILTFIPSPLFDGEIERFSFWIRLLFFIPLVLSLLYLKPKHKLK